MKHKSKSKILKRFKHQTGRTSKKADAKAIAKYPGKRKSRKGKTYWESRKNRSDLNKKKRL